MLYDRFRTNPEPSSTWRAYPPKAALEMLRSGENSPSLSATTCFSDKEKIEREREGRSEGERKGEREKKRERLLRIETNRFRM